METKTRYFVDVPIDQDGWLALRLGADSDGFFLRFRTAAGGRLPRPSGQGGKDLRFEYDATALVYGPRDGAEYPPVRLEQLEALIWASLGQTNDQGEGIREMLQRVLGEFENVEGPSPDQAKDGEE